MTAAALIATLHFGVPFFLLLFRAIKQNLRALSCVAWLVLIMQLVFVAFEVVPAFPEHSWGEILLAVPLSIGLAGIWFVTFLWFLNRRPALPRHDRNWAQIEHLLELDREEGAREESLAHE